MAIVALDRLHLLAPSADRELLLAGLQTLGVVHLTFDGDAREAGVVGPDDEGGRAREALRYLSDCRDRRQQSPPGPGFERMRVVDRALEIKRQSRQLGDRCDFIVQRLSMLAPWGDFGLPPGGDIGGYRFWFYVVPLNRMAAVRASNLIRHVVRRDNRMAYVVVISDAEPPATAMPVPRTHTGAVPASALRAELERLRLDLEDLAAERASMTRWIARLRDALDAADDQAALAAAIAGVDVRSQIVVVHGWAPRAARDRIESFAIEHGFACSFRAPRDDESPPSLLHNPRPLMGGESVVGMWQLPGYRDVDPSPVIAVSFALFFAMIMSDACYAALLGVLLAACWPRLGREPDLRRLRALAALIVAVSAIYGVLVGSYFGVAPTPGSVLAALQVLDMQDYSAMIEISVLIGAVHLLVATMMAGWRRRGHHQATGHFGWSLAILGGVGVWQAQMREWPEPLPSLVLAVLCGGLLLVLLFRGRRVVASRRDLLPRLAQGALALTGATKAFGDVLSYLRLFALGLASASLAATFNTLAAQVDAGAGSIGPYLAGALLAGGHTLNFALVLLSATIHGLRLNLIEFYGWAVEQEGKPFRTFHKRASR